MQQYENLITISLGSKHLVVRCLESDIPSMMGYGSDGISVSYKAYTIDFRTMKMENLDFQTFHNIYESLGKSQKQQLWRVYKYLRPYFTYNDLRENLYQTHIAGIGNEEYVLQKPNVLFNAFLRTRGYTYDNNPFEDANPDIRRYENEFIKLRYCNKLKKSNVTTIEIDGKLYWRACVTRNQEAVFITGIKDGKMQTTNYRNIDTEYEISELVLMEIYNG